MPRPAHFTLDEIAAGIFNDYLATNGTKWPPLADIRKAYRCSAERGQAALDEARRVAEYSIPINEVFALAVHAGFNSIGEARNHLRRLVDKHGHSRTTQRELRAALAYYRPQDYTPNLTREELLARVPSGGARAFRNAHQAIVVHQREEAGEWVGRVVMPEEQERFKACQALVDGAGLMGEDAPPA